MTCLFVRQCHPLVVAWCSIDEMTDIKQIQYSTFDKL